MTTVVVSESYCGFLLDTFVIISFNSKFDRSYDLSYAELLQIHTVWHLFYYHYCNLE